MIKLANGTLWVRMPNPPFSGEPWIGYWEEDIEERKLKPGARVIMPSDHEMLLLDALEAAIKQGKNLEVGVTVICKECGEGVAHDVESERTENEQGTKIDLEVLTHPCECIVEED